MVQQLPENEKIRVISISAAPDYTEIFKNVDQYKDAVTRAQQAGILVLDCSGENDTTGNIGPAFIDPTAPDDATKCKGGFPDDSYTLPSSYIGVPCSYRTVAEEYVEGDCTYRYDGVGGLSWGIPYAAGVLAMGWQVNPEMSNDQMLQLLHDTFVQGADGTMVIDPIAFIRALQK